MRPGPSTSAVSWPPSPRRPGPPRRPIPAFNKAGNRASATRIGGSGFQRRQVEHQQRMLWEQTAQVRGPSRNDMLNNAVSECGNQVNLRAYAWDTSTGPRIEWCGALLTAVSCVPSRIVWPVGGISARHVQVFGHGRRPVGADLDDNGRVTGLGEVSSSSV